MRHARCESMVCPDPRNVRAPEFAMLDRPRLPAHSRHRIQTAASSHDPGRNAPTCRLRKTRRFRWPAGLTLVLAFAILGIRRPVGAQSCPVNVPHLTGTWTSLPYQMPINPISVTLLHTGKVLIISGSENDADNAEPYADSYYGAVWDPTGTTSSSVTIKDLNYDVFCSGTSVLPDGRALVVGGTSDYSPPLQAFTGDNRASIYDPVMDRFIQ